MLCIAALGNERVEFPHEFGRNLNHSIAVWMVSSWKVAHLDLTATERLKRMSFRGIASPICCMVRRFLAGPLTGYFIWHARSNYPCSLNDLS